MCSCKQSNTCSLLIVFNPVLDLFTFFYMWVFVFVSLDNDGKQKEKKRKILGLKSRRNRQMGILSMIVSGREQDLAFSFNSNLMF